LTLVTEILKRQYLHLITEICLLQVMQTNRGERRVNFDPGARTDLMKNQGSSVHTRLRVFNPGSKVALTSYMRHPTTKSNMAQYMLPNLQMAVLVSTVTPFFFDAFNNPSGVTYGYWRLYFRSGSHYSVSYCVKGETFKSELSSTFLIPTHHLTPFHSSLNTSINCTILRRGMKEPSTPLTLF